MVTTHSLLPIVHCIACASLLLLSSCQFAHYPPPVRVDSEAGLPQHTLAVAQEAAMKADADSSQRGPALAAWLRTAQEAALLIDDETSCGDGSISRVTVTQVYQHAVGRVLEIIQLGGLEKTGGSTVWPAVPALAEGPQGRWALQVQAGVGTDIRQSIVSVGPVKAPARLTAFRTGVPAKVKTVSDGKFAPMPVTALVTFSKLSQRGSLGQATLRFVDAYETREIKLYASGDVVPVRRARER